jgi:predicted DNA-binding protein (MmcQ/YjbR family)
MHIAQLRDFCLSKKGVTEHFPFDNVTLVFKVMNKIFVLLRIDKWEQGVQCVNLKCDPEKAAELREFYEGVQPGWHSNKKHWNTVTLNSKDISQNLAVTLINHSYDMVVKGLTKKTQVILKVL